MHNHRAPRPTRTLVLVDLENVLTLTPRRCDVTALRDTLEALRGPGVLIELACSHWFAQQYAFDFPFGRSQWRSGADGADMALLDAINHEGIERRFTSVVLFSGDGGFTESISRLAHDGIHTTVVARRGSLSRRLRMASHSHLMLDLGAPDTQAGEGEIDDAA